MLDVYVGSRKLTLSLYIYEGELDATRYSNTYDLWVYTTPKNIDYLKKQVVIAKDLTSDVVKKLEREQRCFGFLRLPAISWLQMIRFRSQIMPHLIPWVDSSRLITGTIACSRPSARTIRRRFSRNSGHSDEPRASDIQGFPNGDAHQLAMVPCHQGVASAGVRQFRQGLSPDSSGDR